MADSTDRADLDLWRKLATQERKGAEPDGLVWPGLVNAYQRALLASVHPEGPLGFARTRHGRARRFWITREALGSRYPPIS